MKAILNLTEQVVIEEIEKLIKHYPRYPYQHAFSVPGLRQKLVAYVLNRVSNFYVVLNECDLNKVDCQSMGNSMVDKSDLESNIHIGIREILEQSQLQDQTPMPERSDTDYSPSDWFG